MSRPRSAVALSLIALATALLPALLRAQGKPRPLEVSGVPALNFDADEGFGYGAILALYRYDNRDATQAVTYRWTVQPTVFLTTQGRRDYTLFVDAPAQSGHPWRYTVYAGREQQLAAPYYGIGNSTAYNSALETGSTRYFYRYGRDRLRATADIQHALLTPRVRVLLGGGASTDRIDLTPFDSGTTLIQRELAGRVPPNGHTNYLRAGLTYDTRDREIGTHTGTWADVIVQRVDKSLGASNDFTRWTAAARRYEPLGERVTFATRVLVQNTTGDAPFYALSEIQTSQRSQDGLGGSSSLRGLPKDRYIGKGIALTNNELRWRALDFTERGRPSSLVLSGFLDAGRVWADGVDLSSIARELHAGYGGGVRLGYGQSFVVAADVAHSSQATLPIYIGLGYLF